MLKVSIFCARTAAHRWAPLGLRYQRRMLSSGFRPLDLEDDIETWPKTAPNTVLNICPQGEVMVVERLGKLHAVKEAGWFIAIPFVDNISYRIDMREKALSINPQAAITKDNVHVQVSGNLYCQFTDAEKAAYGSKNPLYAVKQLAQSSMRAAIGELELDQILHARAQLNTMIRTTIQEAATKWVLFLICLNILIEADLRSQGVEIMRYEITEVMPDKVIMEAMDKQAAAERGRRKKVLDAEGNTRIKNFWGTYLTPPAGDKRSAELESEGIKIKMQNESEGTMIKIKVRMIDNYAVTEAWIG
jgi:regulator of protease activity HflC (stomatin/prohibitin superfamily)